MADKYRHSVVSSLDSLEAPPNFIRISSKGDWGFYSRSAVRLLRGVKTSEVSDGVGLSPKLNPSLTEKIAAAKRSDLLQDIISALSKPVSLPAAEGTTTATTVLPASVYGGNGENDVDATAPSFICFLAAGRAIGSAIGVAESVKRRLPYLLQTTSLLSVNAVHIYKPTEEGLDEIRQLRKIDVAVIMLASEAADVLDKSCVGFQRGVPEGVVITAGEEHVPPRRSTRNSGKNTVGRHSRTAQQKGQSTLSHRRSTAGTQQPHEADEIENDGMRRHPRNRLRDSARSDGSPSLQKRSPRNQAKGAPMKSEKTDQDEAHVAVSRGGPQRVTVKSESSSPRQNKHSKSRNLSSNVAGHRNNDVVTEKGLKEPITSAPRSPRSKTTMSPKRAAHSKSTRVKTDAGAGAESGGRPASRVSSDRTAASPGLRVTATSSVSTVASLQHAEQVKHDSKAALNAGARPSGLDAKSGVKTSCVRNV
eukprot:GHVQ01023939.1.p1 GENE.GHVQ01023939.1~~GHVQ01023939.1.p1  ORF type:complete len:477 (-),score=58.04 GHVQ01023939.1:1638-3068(-)